MKNFLFFIIIFSSLQLFSQNNKEIPTSFTVENNKIAWTNIYQTDSKNIIKDLKKKLLLNFDIDSTGTAKDLQLICKNISIYAKNNFRIAFRIEVKENKYKVAATNIIFENNNQLNINNNRSELKYFNIENYILNKDLSFKTDSFNIRTTKCLDEFLYELFLIPKENTKW